MPSCCLIFTGFLTILVSIIVGMYFNRIMPEGMPDDQFTGLRVLSVGSDIIEFLVSEPQQYRWLERIRGAVFDRCNDVKLSYLEYVFCNCCF